MTENLCKAFETDCDINPKCIEEKGSYPEFVAIDKKSTAAKQTSFIIKNISGKDICKIKIDGCVFTDHTRRPDYLFINNDDKIIYIVELKGTDMRRAISQIYTFIDLFKRKNSFEKVTVVNAYVVLTKLGRNVPDVDTITRKDIKEKMDELNGKFDYSEGAYELEV